MTRRSMHTLLALLFVQTACGHASVTVPGAEVPAKTTLRLRVTTSDRTNGGSTLYGVVRAMDAKTAPVAESYQEASEHLFAVPPEPSVLSSYPVIPGSDSEVVVEADADSALLLYFFFSHPGTRWRVPVQAPLPKSIVVRLGENEVAEVANGTGR